MGLTPIQIESIKSEVIKNQREALREEFPFVIIGLFSKRLAHKIKSHYYISKSYDSSTLTTARSATTPPATLDTKTGDDTSTH